MANFLCPAEVNRINKAVNTGLKFNEDTLVGCRNNTAGCPAADRGPLVEAALGALQGALGDWGSLRPPA